MSEEQLIQLGPIAVVVILLVRELVAAWKWREEQRSKSVSERHADDVRELVATVREDLAAARVQLQTITAASQRAHDEADGVFRVLYEQLQGRVEATTDERFDRLACVASRSAEALEQATTMIELALDRLGGQDARS